MVRLDIYDYKSNTTDDVTVEIYTDTSMNIPNYVDDEEDKTKPTKDEKGQERDVHAETDGRDQSEEQRTTLAKVPENLSQVWWEFLGETSLHGCKNVRERHVVARIAWCTAILLMAATLGWALVNLVLRYQEHPFVTMWNFRREATILAPGITLCLPAKFSKTKLENSMEAYQMLAYEMTGIPLYGEHTNIPAEEITEKFAIWRNQLENVTVTQTTKDIGFPLKEIFLYGVGHMNGGEVDLLAKMTPVLTSLDASCWMVNWHSPTYQERHVSYDSAEENSREISDESTGSFNPNVTSEESSSSNKNSMENEYDTGRSLNETFNFTSFVISNLLSPTGSINISSLTNALRANLTFGKLSSRRPTNPPTPSPSSSPLFLDSTKLAADQIFLEPEQVDRTSESIEMGEVDGNIADYKQQNDKLGSEKLQRLSPQDTLVFTVNLRQNNWLSNTYKASLDLYIHEPSRSFWSVEPLLLRPGTLSLVHYTTTTYKYLPLPYKSFSGSDGTGPGGGGGSRSSGCVDTKDFHNPMVSLPPSFYSSEACILEMVMNASAKECGCSYGVFMEIHEVPECSILQFECSIMEVDKAYALKSQRMAQGMDSEFQCPQACKETKFEATVSSADYPPVALRGDLAKAYGVTEAELRDDLMVIMIQPRGPLSVNIEHVPEMTLLTIVGSVGGWMGLCLGASLLTLTEFFQAALLSAWILYKKLARIVQH